MTALFEGLEQDDFPLGYFPDERATWEDGDTNGESIRRSLERLVKTRHWNLTGTPSNELPYRDGFRVGRILMDLQARETVGASIFTVENIESYNDSVSRDNKNLSMRSGNQDWFRTSFSGNTGRLAIQSPILEEVAAEYERFRWPDEKWQIRMGLFDAYMISIMGINAAMDQAAEQSELATS